MGVPSFFRWLSRKYPKIISPVLEEVPQVVDNVQLPIDYSSANQNGELDNLYLDMNGIVHPCSHPENKPPPETEDEMLLAVFEYTNRVLNMARPRKVLVIAVDGVAPRAKMNQQRARRFRSARDAKIENETREQILREKEAVGEMIDDSIKNKKTWDSNAITPGTPFMDKLAQALRYWIAFKLSTDPGWKDLQVIISDATVPGEGEHKIMNFIRSQRADPQYNPNTTHCIYGLDADLIFLGLATHEPHFKILREDVFAQSGNGRNRKKPNINDTINMTEEEKQLLAKESSEKPFLWLHISVLREYLAVELSVPRLSFPFDLERAIDDWVFMCFFCGNDFLPHLPSLDVRENSIDILLDIWKVILPTLKTYLTCDGKLNLESVEILLQQLGSREADVFKSRHIQEIRKQEAMQRRKLRNSRNISKGQDKHPTKFNEQLQMYDTNGNLASGSWNLTTSDMVKFKKELMLANEGDKDAIAIIKAQSDQNNKLQADITEKEMDTIVQEANKANRSAADIMIKKLNARKRKLEIEESKKDEEDKKIKSVKMEGIATDAEKTLDEQIKAEVAAEVEDEEEEEEETDKKEDVSKAPLVGKSPYTSGTVDTDDQVRLFEPGYTERYYTVKFNVSESDIEALKKDVVRCYIEGVSWVLLYYYQGCASWNWYYPYHYAPFAADFVNIKDMNVKFELGEPFLPYEQLMSVLPAASGHTLPPVFRPLMSEPDSEIIEFYPEEFPIDMNGKKMSWQGIALLPFIDEKKLLKVVREQYKLLTDAEKARNVRNIPILLINNKNSNYEVFVKEFYTSSADLGKEVAFNYFKSGLSGIAMKDVEGFQLNGKVECPIQAGSLPTLSTNYFLKLSYKLKPLPSKNKSVLLNGFIPSEAMLNNYDLDSIYYKYNNGYQNRNNMRNFDEQIKQNIVPVGPSGVTQYKPRVGGYRSFYHFEQLGQNQQVAYQENGPHGNYNSNYDRYSTQNSYGANQSNGGNPSRYQNYNSHQSNYSGKGNYGQNNRYVNNNYQGRGRYSGSNNYGNQGNNRQGQYRDQRGYNNGQNYRGNDYRGQKH